MSRVVVVTGASAGVGRAAARLFAERGDRIGLIARGEAGLAAAAAEVEDAGGRALPITADVADAAAVEASAARVEDQLGPIDVWVNNAMAAVLARVEDTTAEEFRRVHEVTFLGSVHGTQAALRRMLPRNRGRIIQVGSALGIRGIPLQATYCSAKHALQGFSESLRTELIASGTRVTYTIVQMPGLNTTQFGWVRTRGIRGRPQPVPPAYQPELAARAIVFAADRGRREVWVGGSTAYSIIGSRLAPWVADQYLARTAIQGQQSDEPISEPRPDYLDDPLDDDRDFGSHGSFDDRAHARSLQFFLSRHRLVSLAAAGAAATGALASWVAKRGTS